MLAKSLVLACTWIESGCSEWSVNAKDSSITEDGEGQQGKGGKSIIPWKPEDFCNPSEVFFIASFRADSVSSLGAAIFVSSTSEQDASNARYC